jgi:hypothetical protein
MAAVAYDIAALKALPASKPSICIPRVFPNITWQRVKSVFEELGFGDVEKVDMVNKTSSDGKPIKRVFVHFKAWNTLDDQVNQARTDLLNGQFVQLTYDQPWFWRCYMSNVPRPQHSNNVEVAVKKTKPKTATDFKIVTTSDSNGWQKKVRVPRKTSTGAPSYASVLGGIAHSDRDSVKSTVYQTPPRIVRSATVESRSPPAIERPIIAPSDVSSVQSSEIDSLKSELAEMKAVLQSLVSVMSPPKKESHATSAPNAPIKKFSDIVRSTKVTPKTLFVEKSSSSLTPTSPSLNALAERMKVVPFPDMDSDVCWGDLVDSDCE